MKNLFNKKSKEGIYQIHLTSHVINKTGAFFEYGNVQKKMTAWAEKELGTKLNSTIFGAALDAYDYEDETEKKIPSPKDMMYLEIRADRKVMTALKGKFKASLKSITHVGKYHENIRPYRWKI